MTHRVHPYIFRIGQTKPWKSRWFNVKNFSRNLREDTLLRQWLAVRLRSSRIEDVEIERSPSTLQIIIRTSRPGFLIGRGGEGVEKLKEEIKKFIAKVRKRFLVKSERPEEIRLTIEEIRGPEKNAAVLAEHIAEDLEKRVPFRRALKQALNKVTLSKDIQGIKIAIKGRLDGAEMARYEWLKKGRIPLQAFRADIDYAERTAYTTYGTIGVKVWIYKGDVFSKTT